MRKTGKVLGSVLLGIVFMTLQAFPWGSATHAYIASRIGKILPLMNANEMYGIMVPDLFNYAFDTDPRLIPAIQYFTHGSPGQEGFLDVWKKASPWGYQKSVAFGYVAHNDVWGVDSTAHHSGRIIGQGVGYVVSKAGQLLVSLVDLRGGNGPVPLWKIFGSLGLTKYDDQLDLAHNLFETAGDIHLAQKDCLIGEKMFAAALLRSDDAPELLTKVMGQPLKSAIYAAEKGFRNSMGLYGALLVQGQETAISSMADQMAQLGIAYLVAKGLPAPNLSLARVLAEQVIRVSLPLCSDYMTEVNATIDFVKLQLKNHNIRY